MSTMQLLGRSSLRVRKLPGVNSSLLAKFMEEEGGVGIRKESQKICYCGRFLFPVYQWFLCDKVFFFICIQCKSRRALGSQWLTHCFVSSVYGFRAYFLPLLELTGVGEVRIRLSIMTFVTPTSRSIGQNNLNLGLDCVQWERVNH